MKQKLFTLFLVLVTSVGTIFAYGTKIGDLYYYLDATNRTAEVTYQASSKNNYSGLTSADIPSSVTYYNQTYSVTSIGEGAFLYCSSLTSITIPYSVTSIGMWAFGGCSSLTSVTIPNSVKSIGESAFADCSSLTSVTIPNSVTGIGGWAFEYCSSLTSVTIPNSVKIIGEYAFSGCSSLTSVTIPNSVTSFIGEGAFSGCSGLTSIIVEAGNTAYDSRDNCNAIIETSTNTLIAGCQNTTIPNSVTSIGYDAFGGCSSLTSITIPNSVTSIGEYAFAGCAGLTFIIVEAGNTAYDSRDNCNAIIETSTNTLIAGCQNTTIPNSVTSIGGSAFAGCSSLTSITIPNSVTSIGKNAFSGCSSLTSVTIPNNVTSIGDYAFLKCSSLTSVYNYAATPQAINSYVFGNVNKNTCKLYVPKESVDLYKAADVWNEFENILPIAAEGVETESTTVETSETTAEITWPEVSGAYTYELIIRDKDGNIVCTLIFNANGQLTQITFAAPARDHSTQSSGFSFTVTGLDSGTSYDLTITAKDENGAVLQTTTQSFTTAGVASAVDNVTTGDTRLRKMLIDGQLLIIKNGKTYNVTGAQVK